MTDHELQALLAELDMLGRSSIVGTHAFNAAKAIRVLMQERDRALKTLAGCDWYWPSEDHEMSADLHDIMGRYDYKTIVAIDRGGVVDTRWYFYWPDGDGEILHEFETEEEAEAALARATERGCVMTILAQEIAARAHAGQTDKAGKPYIEHCRRVAERLVADWPASTEDEIAAAWLHDVMEDTKVEFNELRSLGVSEWTMYLVYSLSRPDGMPYLDWIRRMAEDCEQAVIRVKLADNADNSDPARVAMVQDGERMVRERYAPARKILLSALKPETT
jgi:hypothetical protein